MRTLFPLTIGLTALLLTGCVNITQHITPENPTVKPISDGSDCSYIIFGFGYGTNTIEAAMANANPPIKTLRVARVNIWYFFPLPVEGLCIEAVGEPAPGVKRDPGYDPTEKGAQ